MSTENNPPDTPRPPAPLRASRWSSPRPPSNNPYRLPFRLLGIPILILAAWVLYRGVDSRLVLPACDSDSAKRTLSDVLKQLKLEPERYEPIKTVSTSKDEVVCNAVLPLPGGGDVVADYTFYWQGSKVNMRYSIRREKPKSS